MLLRDLLNAHRWRDHDLQTLVLVLRHRGAPFDKRHVAGADVSNINRYGFVLGSTPFDDAEDNTFIPWHRVLAVIQDGATLWSKR